MAYGDTAYGDGGGARTLSKKKQTNVIPEVAETRPSHTPRSASSAASLNGRDLLPERRAIALHVLAPITRAIDDNDKYWRKFDFGLA